MSRTPASDMSSSKEVPQSLQVTSSVEGLQLAPQPGAWIRGRLRLESKSSTGSNRPLDPGQTFLALRPVDGEDQIPGGFAAGDVFSQISQIAADGSFEWKNVPPGRYSVQLAGDGGGDWFVKSVPAGGRDDEAGISVNGGVVTLDLVASPNGAIADGVVTDAKGEPVANAVIVAVPEARLRARLDRYRKTVSDQTGRFTLHGMPAGDYTLFAWESVDDEAYYNPEFLKGYEGQGSALRVAEGDRKGVQIQAIPDGEPHE